MARNQKTNEEMKEERYRKILSCAVRLFATRGFSATKVSDIAHDVGMSQGLLYHYFRSKEEIFTEIVRRAFDQMNSAALALEQSQLAAKDKLVLACKGIIDGLEQAEDFAWYSTLISLASISDAVPEKAKALIQKERAIPYEVVTRIVQAGQADGSLRQAQAHDLALVFWTTVKGLALHKTALGDDFFAPAVSVLTNIFFEEDTV